MSMILGYIKEREISFLFFLLLVLLVIVLWNLYKKEKKRAEAAELSVAGERKYYGAFVKERKDFFIYFRKEDLRILYISPNFQHITGIASKLMYEDIEVLNTLYTHTTRRRIQGKINDWDKRDSLEFECDYKKRGSDLLNFVTLCCGILTIETSDCFFRSFCFIGQNGAFSTTEQNQ